MENGKYVLDRYASLDLCEIDGVYLSENFAQNPHQPYELWFIINGATLCLASYSSKEEAVEVFNKAKHCVDGEGDRKYETL
jgi:hypothetical protein